MSDALLKVVKLGISCPCCQQTNRETFSNLVAHQSVTCYFCGQPIDLSSKEWRTLIKGYVDDLRHFTGSRT